MASGPSVAIVPWLVSATCAVLAWLALATVTHDSEPVSSTLPHWAARSWLIAALLSSAIALTQYFGQAHYLAPWANVPAAGDVYANLRQRNQFATLAVMGLAVLLLWRPARPANGWTYAGVALLSTANAATASRTGLLQTLLVMALAVAWRSPGGRQRIRLALAAGGSYLVATLLLPMIAGELGLASGQVWNRWMTGEGCASRMVLWSNVLHLISLKPLLGWGWGELDYAHYAVLYEGPRFCDILDNAHNLPLHLAVELGAPIAVLFCAAVLWWAAREKPWRETDGGRRLAWAVVAVIGLHSLLEYPLWYGPFQIAVLLCLVILTRRQRIAPRNLRVSLMIGAVLCAAVAYAAWDYRRVSQLYLAPEDRLPAYRDNTLAKVRGSRLFRNHVFFAELTLTPLTRANAQWTYDTALDLLHYSPEPRVVEKVIESALLLGHDEVALAHLARFRAAFPKEHADWARDRAQPARPAPDLVKD